LVQEGVQVNRYFRSRFGTFLLAAWAGSAVAAGCSVAREGLGNPTASGATREEPPSPDAAADGPDVISEDAGSQDAAVAVGGAGSLDAAVADGAVAPPDAAAPLDAAADVAADAAIIADGGTSPSDRAADPGCPDSPELALCLRFEGTIADEAPAHSAVAPADVAYVEGPSGLAIDLHPPAELTLADSALFYSPSVTIEAWVRPRSLVQTAAVLEHQGQYALTVEPDGTARCSAGATSALQAGAVAADAWTSLACTIDPGAVALWIDGQKVAESAATGLPSPPASRLTVGWGGAGDATFDGYLDNVRLWSQVRTGPQLCASALSCR
jgi:hypothetical protein